MPRPSLFALAPHDGYFGREANIDSEGSGTVTAGGSSVLAAYQLPSRMAGVLQGIGMSVIDVAAWSNLTFTVRVNQSAVENLQFTTKVGEIRRPHPIYFALPPRARIDVLVENGGGSDYAACVRLVGKMFPEQEEGFQAPRELGP